MEQGFGSVGTLDPVLEVLNFLPIKVYLHCWSLEHCIVWVWGSNLTGLPHHLTYSDGAF